MTFLYRKNCTLTNKSTRSPYLPLFFFLHNIFTLSPIISLLFQTYNSRRHDKNMAATICHVEVIYLKKGVLSLDFNSG